MRYILILTCCCILSSCSDSFINHELKFEKTGNCTGTVQPVKMISNINGERYEFVVCMDDGFDGKQYNVERRHDSILVSFPVTAGKAQAQYNLVLDIDAKPAYHFINLAGQELTIVPMDK